MPSEALPVKTGALLLAPRVGQLNRIAALAGVPDGHFDSLYLGALEKLAELVQELPGEDKSSTLLDEGLARAVTTLTARQGYRLPKGADPELVSRQTDLWTYAAFTAAIMKSVRSVFTQSVQLYDAAALEVGPWCPWKEEMGMRAGWYGPVVEASPGAGELPCYVALLLATRIIPDKGMAWLWSDYKVLRCWLGAISEDAALGAELYTLLTVDGGARRELAREVEAPTFGSRTETASALHLEDELERFFVWLRAKQYAGELSVNRRDSPIHIVRGGVLLVVPRLFRLHSGVKWSKMLRKVSRSPAVTRAAGDGSLQGYELRSSKGSERIEGVIVEDTDLIFHDESRPDVNSDLVPSHDSVRGADTIC